MEDNKNENQSSGYTGEYGNSVDGNYEDRNQSTYSYSYKDGNSESTHSGDYYASDYAQNTSDNTDSGTQNTENTYQNTNTGYQNTGNTYQNQNTGNTYQNAGNAYQNGYSYDNAARQNGNWNQASAPKRQRERKPMTFGRRIALTAACAVIFGLVAGICFVGVKYLSDRISGNGSSGNVEISSNSSNDDTQQASLATGSAISSSDGSADVSAITEQCMPFVVAITSTTEGTDYYDLFGQYYQGEDTTSSGSGFIVGKNDTELLIATNNHVIEDAKTISVQFIDDEIYEAEEKGSDSSNDLAVVAVKISDVKDSTMESIKVADLGDSEETKVGEMVIAIGNALGYGQSVTVGYISAKDREITETADDGSTTNTIQAIQTDAAINPGNSGGALINMQGQVIGINSAKISDSSVEGVGYAIPISVATPIIDELMNRETLSDDEKGYLGITGQTVTDAGTTYNVPYGVYVVEVAEGGAADEAGIKENDVITAVDKMEVTTIESLQEKINSYKKGTEVEITLKRSNNGKYVEKKVTVTLQGSESLDSLSDSSSSSGDSDSGSSNNDSGNGNDSNGNNGSDNNGNSENGNSSENNQENGGSGESFWNFFN